MYMVYIVDIVLVQSKQLLAKSTKSTYTNDSEI